MRNLLKIEVSITLFCMVLVAVVLWHRSSEFKHSAAGAVQDIYSNLYREDSKLSSLDQAEGIYSTKLQGLIKNERQKQIASGGTGKLSADPLCNCQNPASVKVIKITLNNENLDKASVNVALSVSGNIEKLSLDLIKESGGWKISDVVSQEIPSLEQFLNQG